MNLCGRIYMADPATGHTARCGKEAGHKDALDHGPAVIDKGEISDGYHTFNELYAHRLALTAVLAQILPSWRSREHHPDDAPMFEGGYFIVGIDLPAVGTITYHYKLEHWDRFEGVDVFRHARKWDGAPPAATVERLLRLATEMRINGSGT